MKPAFANDELVLVKQEILEDDGDWVIGWKVGKVISSAGDKLKIYRIEVDQMVLTFFNDGSIRSFAVDVDALVSL